MIKEGAIISRIIKEGDKVAEEKVGEGFETGHIGDHRGVVRQMYSTDEGIIYYADRTLPNGERSAKEAMRIYKALKEANLPTFKFAKVLKRNEDGKRKYYLAMDDLTEDDKFEIIEVNEPFVWDMISRRSDDPELFRAQMVSALAVMHNCDIVDFHPGLSYAIQVPNKGFEEDLIQDFYIIDLPNLVTKESDQIDDFDEECRDDLRRLLEGIISSPDQNAGLSVLYNKIRKEKIVKYSDDLPTVLSDTDQEG